VRRERILSDPPVTDLLGRRLLVVLPVVEDQLEEKVRRLEGLLIPIEDALQVLLGCSGKNVAPHLSLEAGCFAGLSEFDPCPILRLVLVADDVALVFAGLFEEPREDPSLRTLARERRIRDPRAGALPVDVRYIVARRDAPVQVSA